MNPLVCMTIEFKFDSAHFMPTFPEGHPNRRMHGHTYYGFVSLKGVPHSDSGFLVEETEIKKIIEPTVQKLDHFMLNEIVGMGLPTTENICVWLWNEWKDKVTGLCKIEIRRPSVGLSVSFSGEFV